MTAVFLTLDAILNFYTWIIILSAVFSWLYAFNVINSSNQFVNQVGNMLYQLTEPALRPIRRILPMFGAIDLSPLALLFFIFFLRWFLQLTIAPMFGVHY